MPSRLRLGDVRSPLFPPTHSPRTGAALSSSPAPCWRKMAVVAWEGNHCLCCRRWTFPSSSHRNPRCKKVNRTRPARCAPRRPPPSYPMDSACAIPQAAARSDTFVHGLRHTEADREPPPPCPTTLACAITSLPISKCELDVIDPSPRTGITARSSSSTSGEGEHRQSTRRQSLVERASAKHGATVSACWGSVGGGSRVRRTGCGGKIKIKKEKEKWVLVGIEIIKYYIITF